MDTMINLSNSHYGITIAEMLQDQDGLYRQGEPVVFGGDDARTLTAGVCCSAANATDAWTCWMTAQGFEVTELPQTERTRGWGKLFSAVSGSESRIFALSVGEC